MKRYKAPVFAVCVNNSEHPASLELHKLYRILPDEDSAQDDDLRVVDESGEDYLYPADYFVILEMPRRAVRTLNVSFTRLPASTQSASKSAPVRMRAMKGKAFARAARGENRRSKTQTKSSQKAAA